MYLSKSPEKLLPNPPRHHGTRELLSFSSCPSAPTLEVQSPSKTRQNMRRSFSMNNVNYFALSPLFDDSNSSNSSQSMPLDDNNKLLNDVSCTGIPPVDLAPAMLSTPHSTTSQHHKDYYQEHRRKNKGNILVSFSRNQSTGEEGTKMRRCCNYAAQQSTIAASA
jgi:hypothetical protein